MNKLRLIGGGHHHHIRQAGHISNVERPGMGCSVRAHLSGAVNGKTHGQVLQGHIMHHLIIGALQEGGINRTERLIALGCEPGGKGHRMLLGNADIKGAGGKGPAKQVEPGSAGHSGSHGNDLVVRFGGLDQTFGKNARISRSIGLGLGLRPRHHIKCGHAMIFVG